MVAQNGPMPKLFNEAEVQYLVTSSTDGIDSKNDFSQVQQEAFQKVNADNNVRFVEIRSFCKILRLLRLVGKC
jgi:hypothetical protein